MRTAGAWTTIASSEGGETERPPACTCGVRASERPQVNGVGFEPVSPDELVQRVERFCRCRRSHVIHFCAAHPTVIARSDLAYRDILNRGLNVPDGVGVVLALRLLGHPAQRLPGSDAFALLCERGVRAGLRHYLFGGAAETVDRLHRSLRVRYPGIRVVGAESPPFRPMSECELSAASTRIRRARTDLLWVGLGAPKQDWVAERLRQHESASVILCVGAAFDFLSGAKRRAPDWIQRSGLEWLYRLACEPNRLWRRYLVGNVAFAASVLSDYLRADRK
jgi:N-acetylglucosaminyldiphosphoundecaprenol N-acetyl-beta-D-mannosaminyltransferase